MKAFFTSAWLLMLCLLAAPAFSQSAIHFEKETHDFGDVVEGAAATYEFTFVNQGKEPVMISNVSASCGCTTPSWTKEPVMPGKKGSITASYGSQGRPGAFNKSITVITNSSTPTKVLYIKGNVVDKPAYTPEQLSISPVLKPGKEALLQFGKLEVGQTSVARFNYTNTGKSDLEITQLTSSCNCVVLSTPPAKLKPGQSATLELKYTPRALQHGSPSVVLYSNDLANPRFTVKSVSEVVESVAPANMLKETKPAVSFQ
jgi:hypothetical protein